MVLGLTFHFLAPSLAGVLLVARPTFLFEPLGLVKSTDDTIDTLGVFVMLVASLTCAGMYIAARKIGSRVPPRVQVVMFHTSDI